MKKEFAYRSVFLFVFLVALTFTLGQFQITNAAPNAEPDISFEAKKVLLSGERIEIDGIFISKENINVNITGINLEIMILDKDDRTIWSGSHYENMNVCIPANGQMSWHFSIFDKKCPRHNGYMNPLIQYHIDHKS